MQTWFEHTPKSEPTATSDELGAYKAGRADETAASGRTVHTWIAR